MGDAHTAQGESYEGEVSYKLWGQWRVVQWNTHMEYTGDGAASRGRLA